MVASNDGKVTGLEQRNPDMVFETQVVMVIDQMLRIRSPRAMKGLIAVLTVFYPFDGL